MTRSDRPYRPGAPRPSRRWGADGRAVSVLHAASPGRRRRRAQDRHRQNVEALEQRVLLAGDFFADAVTFANDARIVTLITEDFDSRAHLEDLSSATFSGMSMQEVDSPFAPPTAVDVNQSGSAAVTPSSGDIVVEPLAASRSADGMMFTFDRPVRAFGIDVLLEALTPPQDHVQSTEIDVTVFGIEGELDATTYSVFPGAADTTQFVGYVSDK